MKWEEAEDGNKTDLVPPTPSKLSLTKKDSSSANYSTSQKRCCNCKQSRCVKLYCECFANGVYCTGTCNCVDCWNNANFEEQRKAAIQSTLEKNPNAFQPKITTQNFVETKKADVNYRHNKGCSCKKSGCMKKYCECFQGGIPCTELCKCLDCHNTKEYYDKLKTSKTLSTEPIRQEDLGDSNALFFNFLLVCGDEDSLAKFVSEGKEPGQGKKELSIQQNDVEELYGKLMKMAEMSSKEYLNIKENNQHVEEYFEKIRKKIKKENSHSVQAIVQNGLGLNANSSGSDNEQKLQENHKMKEEKEESNGHMETDDLACNDEDANELSTGFQQLEAMKELLKATTQNKNSAVKENDVHVDKEKEIAPSSSMVIENGVSTKDNQEQVPKLSLFQLKKNKILKEFISGLRKFSGMSE